jgi:hypothetical protein
MWNSVAMGCRRMPAVPNHRSMKCFNVFRTASAYLPCG